MASQPRESQTARRAAPPPRSAFGFLRSVVDELRKVVWPTPQELYRYTVVVVVTVLIIAVFIGGVDAAVAAAAKRWIYGGGP